MSVWVILLNPIGTENKFCTVNLLCSCISAWLFSKSNLISRSSCVLVSTLFASDQGFQIGYLHSSYMLQSSQNQFYKGDRKTSRSTTHVNFIPVVCSDLYLPHIPHIWAIYYKSLTWFKAILGGFLYNHHRLGWPRRVCRYKLPRHIPQKT